ncbi:pentatricopeptide repeat-containing protein At1g77360, mitochondrial-like [Phoenix dactylifera]|uniref:Pentatricopeptide repeat-containing protein At1g77360, mitochondrial-like n=1 Tax=Phoenix dactylifera TaxID=42345 RepID=A0A8B7BP53_PHODC|nr:pentatricopeptide repeat-containing protein At1g77360, mitochondrial-like [Phoenix dactylifera]
MSHRKRPTDDDHPLSDHSKRPHARSPPAVAGAAAATDPHRRRKTFPSYLDAPELPTKIRLLCEIIANTHPASAVERALDDAGVRVSTTDVEEVLKLSYSLPAPAVAFFRWAGSCHLAHQHSTYSWNLIVDILGKNELFDAMWDAVRSMRSERLLSFATFASVFSSLASAGRPEDALAAFHSMDVYGVPRSTIALNSLLSAVCLEGRVSTARTFLGAAAPSVAPDADTFAILLEGCEGEDDPRTAREVFADMIASIGWDPANIPAYDAFLTTLVRSGPVGLAEALKFLDIMQKKRCFPGIKFFRDALECFVKNNDARGARELWDLLAGHHGCFPDTAMYNSMITLQCYLNQIDIAQRFLDEMITYGAFPNSQTYNVMLQFLLKARKLREAAAIFNEMVKNECCPTAANCASAIRIFLDSGDAEMALKVWKCMVANDLQPLEKNGNMLVEKLRGMDRLPEACKYAEDIIDRGIKLNSSTLSKLRQSLLRVGKGSIHDHLLMKWKSH